MNKNPVMESDIKNGSTISDMPWHAMETREVCNKLGVSPESGLSPAGALRRSLESGKNEIAEGRKKSAFSIFMGQFRDFMILILVAAAAVSLFIGEFVDSAAIIVIVILNAIIGFTQEYRADKAVAALKNMAVAGVKVLRDKTNHTIPSTELVPGDIVFTETGCIIPADMRIIHETLLSVDESALTGESVAQDKSENKTDVTDIPLGERKNMLYKGTKVVRGRAQAVVTETGMRTELGKIAGIIRTDTEPKTPLQKRISLFGKRLTIIILAVCVVIFLSGIQRSESTLTLFMTVVSLAVAAIPEALPAVITIGLAIGARKMARKNALIRSLPAVETLGSVTWICTDKTGTLTQNIMRLEKIFIDEKLLSIEDFFRTRIPDPEKAGFDLLAKALILNNDATVLPSGESEGEPTEAALLAAGLHYDPEFFQKTLNTGRVAEIPFDSDRKCMSTFHRYESGFFQITKGAPEILLEKCILAQKNNSVVPVDIDSLKKIADQLAGNGYRVILYACRYLEELPPKPAENDETGLTFLGLTALMDPPRENAHDAVKTCIRAGITPVMITGDHPATARNIAMRLSIADDHDPVITGARLQQMSDIDFLPLVKDLRVYARVSPLQKIRIVKALQSRGEYVAMTGDGINDAPALTLAEIGIAMGKSGTDVARESSDMTLLDDNFSTIVAAIEEGRRVYDNIRKFIRYILTGNFAEILTVTLAPIFGMPVPLIPIQILWINLITDSLPALALANEAGESDAMDMPPRPPSESIFARGLGVYILIIGILIAGISLATQKLFFHLEHWQTMVFTVLSFSQLTQTFSLRSERRSVLKTGFFSNPLLSGSFVGMVFLQIMIIYVPVLNPVFNTSPLSFSEFLYCLTVPWIIFLAAEIIKPFIRRI